MTRGSGWMLMLCVFIAGVFVGIWMSWSAHKVAGRDLVFEVQDYQMANLLVYPGDRLNLVPPPAGGGTSVTMGWVGNIPCVGGGTATNCTIESRAKAPAGPYFFTCDSSTYSCPDPGVQQSPTGPIQDLSYEGFVETDFSHLVGIKRSYVKKQEPSATAEAHPASGSLIKAIVSCPNGTTVLQDPDGKDLTTINASVGQTVFWISPLQFSLNMSNAPAGLCLKGNPGNGSTQQAQCGINMAVPKPIQYQIQAQTSPACSALAATLITK